MYVYVVYHSLATAVLTVYTFFLIFLKKTGKVREAGISVCSGGIIGMGELDVRPFIMSSLVCFSLVLYIRV